MQKKGGTLRSCVDQRSINNEVFLDSGRLGNISAVFNTRKGKRYFTQLDLASGFDQLPTRGADRHKMAVRGSQGSLFELTISGFGLTAIPAAFARIVKRALGIPHPDVVSWLDDRLISGHT